MGNLVMLVSPRQSTSTTSTKTNSSSTSSAPMPYGIHGVCDIDMTCESPSARDFELLSEHLASCDFHSATATATATATAITGDDDGDDWNDENVIAFNEQFQQSAPTPTAATTTTAASPTVAI